MHRVPAKKRKTIFLGFTSGSSAKGREGIKYEGGETVNDIITPLFDPQDLDNGTKINTAIKTQFLWVKIHRSATWNTVSYIKTHRYVEFQPRRLR